MCRNMVKLLDARERRFVEEYLIDLDPKRAAEAAGYRATVAASKAYQWVSNGKVKPHVFEAIRAATEKREKRTEITADRVLQEIAKLAFSDLRACFDESGRLKRPEDLSDESAAALASIEVVTRNMGAGAEIGSAPCRDRV